MPHETEVAASAQAPAPLQAPVLPHGGLAVQRLSGPHTDRRRWRSCPRLVPTLHAWHSPHALVVQQTPLVQKLSVRHSLVARAGLAEALLVAAAAGLRIADVRRQAVGVVPAGAAARGRAVAHVGRAGERGRGLTDAQTVTGAAIGLRRLTGWTRRLGARRAGAVETAGALAVAEPVGPAAGRALIRAPGQDVDGSVRDVAAHAGRRGQRARLADAGARRLAADALFAEAGEAFVPVRADRAGRLEAAETARAHGRRTGSRRPRCTTACRRPGGRSAAIREAGHRAGRDTDARAVAGGQRREQVGRAGTGRRQAGRARRVPLAGARLALAVGAAGRRIGGRANSRRIGRSGGDVRADAGACRRCTTCTRRCRRCRSRRPARRRCCGTLRPPSTRRRSP